MNKITQYLAFDLGASQARAILGSLHADHFEMEVLHRFTTPLIEENGHLYWDIETIWNEFQKGLDIASRISENLCSLSVSSWGVDYVPLDAAGMALRNPYSYRDGRTSDIVDEVHSIIPESAFFKKTGINSMPINTLYQIYWESRYDPVLFRNTVSRLNIADYFNYRFSGKRVSEKSLASTTQMLDIQSGTWIKELLDELNLPCHTCPEIVPSSTVLGRVQGHPSMHAVASCSHDTACAVATVSAVSKNYHRAFLSSGTWSLLGLERAEPILTDEAFEAGFTNESGPANSIRFLKNLTGLWVLQQCEKEWKKSGQTYTYDELLDEAQVFSESQPLPHIDLGDPRFSEPGNMVQKLQDCCSRSGNPLPQTRGAMVAVILKNLALSYAEAVKQIHHVTQERIDVIHIVGGGSKNRLLSQWTADTSGCTVQTGPVEATAIGNMLLQARALGNIPAADTLKSALNTFETINTYMPSQKQA